MTKKHFRAIAQTIHDLRTSHNLCSPDFVAERFADMLPQFNERFDRHRFLTACGKDPRS